ncbi:MAG: hypothetical protein GY822_09910, partial [Deltaproteobacteria bacterium]|nr:hypothetical protein [Deltaproteobacteria bacterium]
MIYDFLGLKVPVVSSLSHTPHVHHSVNQRRPLVLTHPFEPNSQQVRQLLEHILRVDVKSLRQHKKGDLNRLLNDFEDASQREKEAEGHAGEPPSLTQFARRCECYEVEMKGKVLARDDLHSATVKEVSEHGALIYTKLDLGIGESFEFTFDEERQLIYQATVRSLRAPGLFGIEFVERTIDPVVIDAWRGTFASSSRTAEPTPNPTQEESHV